MFVEEPLVKPEVLIRAEKLKNVKWDYWRERKNMFTGFGFLIKVFPAIPILCRISFLDPISKIFRLVNIQKDQ